MFGRKSGKKARKKQEKKAAKAAKRDAKLAKKAAKADALAAESAEAGRAAADARRTADAAAVDAKTAQSVVTKADRKAEKKQAKAEEKADKAAKAAKAAAPPKTLMQRVTDPREAKKAIAVVRIAGPVIAPYALRAATLTRGWIDEKRAQQLGVTPIEVAAYRGPTGATEARLAGLATALSDLRRRHGGNQQATRFADAADQRLADLTIATRAAASMPSSRRRATLQAVGRELDRLDADLMTYLLPRPGTGPAVVPGAVASAVPSATVVRTSRPSLTK